MRSEEEMVGQYEVLGRICWKVCSETRRQGGLKDSGVVFSKSEWIIRASFKARSFLKYGEARALGIISTTETIKLELGKDEELIELGLKLIYISRNGYKSNSKNSMLFFRSSYFTYHSRNISAYFRRFFVKKKSCQGLSASVMRCIKDSRFPSL
ncbi:hypothetical protein ALC60_05162 [Trachymyrmex zeteki]|uniref:Uncharacterized protein n=1 Tax=Mycetomoellerius zeteki TaxID=64791 RepID=A0A151X6F4_9HYME|nr:hypothetical protein ALC60_05162 [Trachymyrmex zeteki]